MNRQLSTEQVNPAQQPDEDAQVGDVAPLTPQDLVNALQKGPAAQGWDVVQALSVDKVNELFQRQFVLNFTSSNHLPPLNGSTDPDDSDMSYEFVDVILGEPRISFDVSSTEANVNLTIPIISGLAHETRSFDGAPTVVSTEWFSLADEYTITGNVPLAEITSSINNGHGVALDIAAGTDFSSNMKVSNDTAGIIGQFFRGFLKDNATIFKYVLGTLVYDPKGNDLTPTSFKIATQIDALDPNDKGRVLLFIATTYNPKGGSQTNLSLANVVPTGMDVTLLIGNATLFSQILKPAITQQLSEAKPVIDTMTGDNNLQYLETNQDSGTIDLGVVEIDYDSGTYFSGTSGGLLSYTKTPVGVPIASIQFTPNDSIHIFQDKLEWTQPWVHGSQNPITGIGYSGGEMYMRAHVDIEITPKVNSSTLAIDFSTINGDVTVTFNKSTFSEKFLGYANDELGPPLSQKAKSALESALTFSLPEIGTFAVSNLLFPAEHAVSYSEAHVPGDLVVFGTLDPKATALTVSPALAEISTSEKVQFTATQSVKWSANLGTITEDGTYTPPKTLNSTKVVQITATLSSDDTTHAYAVALVTPALVHVNPIIRAVYAGEGGKQFEASLPGSKSTPTWSIVPSVGSFNDGKYTPPASNGSLKETTAVTITATIDNISGEATIVVFPKELNGLAVTPHATSILGPNATQAFSATSSNGKAAQVTWSLCPNTNTGTIDTNGKYTAPASLTAPQGVLVVAQSADGSGDGGYAVVLLGPEES